MTGGYQVGPYQPLPAYQQGTVAPIHVHALISGELLNIGVDGEDVFLTSGELLDVDVNGEDTTITDSDPLKVDKGVIK